MTYRPARPTAVIRRRQRAPYASEAITRWPGQKILPYLVDRSTLISPSGIRQGRGPHPEAGAQVNDAFPDGLSADSPEPPRRESAKQQTS